MLKRDEHFVCKLKNLIYGLKQVFRHWHMKFDMVRTSFGLVENVVNRCIYLKIYIINFAFLFFMSKTFFQQVVTEVCLKNAFLLEDFEMNDLGQAYIVLGQKLIMIEVVVIWNVAESLCKPYLETIYYKNCS